MKYNLNHLKLLMINISAIQDLQSSMNNNFSNKQTLHAKDQFEYCIGSSNIIFYYYNIIVMKINPTQGKRNREQLTITTELLGALKEANLNASWKVQSSKFAKNRTTLLKQDKKQNLMTEEDLDRLFIKSKEKNKLKTEITVSHETIWGLGQNKELLNKCKFLRVDDDFDKMLTGLPINKNQKYKQNSQLLSQSFDLTTRFKRDYLVGKIIGEGAYASVRVAVYKPQNRKIAIKAYQKAKIKQNARKKSVRRQIKILQMLDHPNIVKIYDVVETNNHVNIIMEYLPGISLGTYLKSQTNQRFSENNCKKIIRQLAHALKYLHQRNISHRDIKLENIIMDENLSPKLIDFGFSTCIQSNKRMKIFCGTPSYMAPQIVQKKEYSGQSADIWALGVLCFVLLTGYFPYKGPTDQQLYRKINNAEYPKQQISAFKQANCLINRMFALNPEDRISAQGILNHTWLCEKPKEFKKPKKNQSIQISKIFNHSKQKEEKQKTTEASSLTPVYRDKPFLKTMKDLTSKLNNTYGRSKGDRTMLNPLKEERQKSQSQKKKGKQNQTKILDLLKFEIKKRAQDKSKCKSHRF